MTAPLPPLAPAVGLVQATVKANSVYSCARCFSMGVGDTERHELSALSFEDLYAQLRALPQRPQQMPVGWAHGPAGYICPACLTKEPRP